VSIFLKRKDIVTLNTLIAATFSFGHLPNERIWVESRPLQFR